MTKYKLKVKRTVFGFLETAKRRVGRKSGADGLSIAWNLGVERAFGEATKAITAAFESVADEPSKDEPPEVS